MATGENNTAPKEFKQRRRRASESLGLVQSTEREAARQRRCSTGSFATSSTVATSTTAADDLLDLSMHSFVGTSTACTGAGNLSGNKTGITLRDIKTTVEAEIRLDKTAAAAATSGAEAPAPSALSRRGRRTRTTTPLRDKEQGRTRPSPARHQQQKRRQAARRRNSHTGEDRTQGTTTYMRPKSPRRTRRARSPHSNKARTASPNINGNGNSNSKSPAHKQRRRSFIAPSATEEMRSFSFQVAAASCCSTPHISRRGSTGLGIMPQTQSASKAQQQLHCPLRRQTRRMSMQQNPTSGKSNSLVGNSTTTSNNNSAIAPVNILHEKCRLLLFSQDNNVPAKKKKNEPPRKSHSLDDMEEWNFPADKKSKYKAMLSSNKIEKNRASSISDEDKELDGSNHTNATTNTTDTTMLRKIARERCRSEKRKPSATSLSSTALSQLASFNSLAMPRKREMSNVTNETKTNNEEDEPAIVSDDEDLFVEDNDPAPTDEGKATPEATGLQGTTSGSNEEDNKGGTEVSVENELPRGRPATKLKKKPSTLKDEETLKKKRSSMKKKKSTVNTSSKDAKSNTLSDASERTSKRSLSKSNSSSELSQTKKVASSSGGKSKANRRPSSKAGTSSNSASKKSSTNGKAPKKPKSSFLAEVAAAMNGPDSKINSSPRKEGRSRTIKKTRRPSSNTSNGNGNATRTGNKSRRPPSSMATTAHANTDIDNSIGSQPAPLSPPLIQPELASYGGANPQTPSHSLSSNGSNHYRSD